MASRFEIDVTGEVPEGGTAILTRRVLGNAGVAITQASLTGVAYTIYAFDPNTKTRTAVAHHQDVTVDKADCIFDTLQLDQFWKNADGQYPDQLGYNFRHQPVHIASGTKAFAAACVSYIVEYTLTPSSGEPILLRFLLNCI